MFGPFRHYWHVSHPKPAWKALSHYLIQQGEKSIAFINPSNLELEYYGNKDLLRFGSAAYLLSLDNNNLKSTIDEYLQRQSWESCQKLIVCIDLYRDPGIGEALAKRLMPIYNYIGQKNFSVITLHEFKLKGEPK